MIVRTTVKSIQDIMRQDVGVDGDAQRISQLCWMFFLKIIDDQDQDLEIARDDYRSPIPKKYQWRTWAGDPEGITGEELLTFVNDELFPALKNLTVSNKPGDRRRVVRDVFEDAYNYIKSGQLMRQVINRIASTMRCWNGCAMRFTPATPTSGASTRRQSSGLRWKRTG
jgi:type I restriction enzyme M protein